MNFKLVKCDERVINMFLFFFIVFVVLNLFLIGFSFVFNFGSYFCGIYYIFRDLEFIFILFLSFVNLFIYLFRLLNIRNVIRVIVYKVMFNFVILKMILVIVRVLYVLEEEWIG